MDVSQLKVYSIIACSIWRLLFYACSVNISQIFIFSATFELFGIFSSVFILSLLFFPPALLTFHFLFLHVFSAD